MPDDIHTTGTSLLGSSKQGESKRRVLLIAGSLLSAADRSESANGGVLAAVAAEFGLSVEFPVDFLHAASSQEPGEIAAVLFGRDSLPNTGSWLESLSQLRQAFPFSRLIPCHGFADKADLNQLADAGAFHFLWLPLKESELRQCLGFVWQNEALQTRRDAVENPFIVTNLQPLAIAVQPMPPERSRRSFKYSAA